MIKRIINNNRRKHQKNIFKLSKSKREYCDSIIENKKLNKESDNKKSEHICSNR